MQKLKHYPTPIAGLTLGLAGLASFWSHVTASAMLSHAVLVSAFVLIMFLLCPLVLKFIIYPAELKANLMHPTVGSVVPTLTMTLMLLSQTLHGAHPLFAEKLWLFSVILHALFFMVFVTYRLKNFNLNHMVPSWFIPPLGIAVACLTLPSARFAWLTYDILMFGLSVYSILLPVMLYRLFLGESIEDARKPTLAVLAAPASLALSGYLSIITVPHAWVVGVLLSIAIVMTFSVYIMLYRLVRLPFSPAFSAFTFPLVISATAMFKTSVWMKSVINFAGYSSVFYHVSIVEGLIASAAVIYVLTCYIKFLFETYAAKQVSSLAV